MNLPDSLFDPRFTFDADTHTYTFDGRRLDNVTSVVKRWTPAFNAPVVAARIAERDDRTVEDVLAEWDDARDAGVSLGSEVHEAIEADLLGKEVPALSEEAERRFALYRIFKDDVLQGATILQPELRIYSLKYGIAGTIDLPAILADGCLVLFDWKTNKRFRTGTDGFGRMLLPFDDLTDNEGHRYSLQLSLYRVILEEHGVATDEAAIVHLPAESPEPVIYAAEDLRARARFALRHRNTVLIRRPKPAA